MKKSISIWSFRPEWDWDYSFQLAKEHGFEGIEIDLSRCGTLPLGFGADAVAHVAGLAKKHGLALSGLATGLYWEANGASSDAAIREEAASIMRQQIEAAAALGIDAILVIPASVGVDFIPGCEVVPYDLALERARELLAAVLPLAEEKGVTLCIENVWNKFLLSPVEFRDFIDSFGSSHVGAYFDVGNVLTTGYPEQWITILGHRIKRVHFKDFRRNVADVNGFCELLAGDVEWPAVMEAFRAIGYTGWAAAEMVPPMPFYRHGSEVLIANTSRAMDALFAMGGK